MLEFKVNEDGSIYTPAAWWIGEFIHDPSRVETFPRDVFQEGALVALLSFDWVKWSGVVPDIHVTEHFTGQVRLTAIYKESVQMELLIEGQRTQTHPQGHTP